jgi:hypothetical protein
MTDFSAKKGNGGEERGERVFCEKNLLTHSAFAPQNRAQKREDRHFLRKTAFLFLQKKGTGVRADIEGSNRRNIFSTGLVPPEPIL